MTWHSDTITATPRTHQIKNSGYVATESDAVCAAFFAFHQCPGAYYNNNNTDTRYWMLKALSAGDNYTYGPAHHMHTARGIMNPVDSVSLASNFHASDGSSWLLVAGGVLVKHRQSLPAHQ